MARILRLPQLGQTMEEGTIVAVRIQEGDNVKKGDVVFDVETDKATLEMESPEEGYVKKILVKEGQTIPVNTPVAVLGNKDETIDLSSLELSGAGNSTIETTAARQVSPDVIPDVVAETCENDSVKVVKLPKLGQTMEEGTIVSVFIREGDKVKRGDVIFEVETDKTTLEMESSEGGCVKKILVEKGQTVPINTPVVILGSKDDAIDRKQIDVPMSQNTAVSTEAKREVAVSKSSAAEDKHTPSDRNERAGRVFASPRAKKTAKERGIDIMSVRITPGAARVTEADVQKAAQAGQIPGVSAPVYNWGQKISANRLQKILAKKMLQSKRDIPCFYLNIQADVTEMVKRRTELNKTSDVKISFNDFLIRAVSMGLKQFPIMTGQYIDDSIQLAGQIDIGLAISTDEGLVAPIIKDVANKKLKEIAVYCQGLIARAKSNKLTLEDLQGGSITISNLGGFGIHSFIPIVVPGQTTILGIGRIADTCVPLEGNILIRKMMDITLSVDHKVANGADAAKFLNYIKDLLENPSFLME